MFLTTALATLTAIFQLFLICAAAGILVRKAVVTQEQVSVLSVFTVNICLPCLIFSKIISQFDPFGMHLWWTLPLVGFLMIMAGLGLAFLLFKMNRKKSNLLPLASMQNAIYLVLPTGRVLFPEQFDRFALYCFLLIIGLTPIMWSLGKVLISGGKGARIHARDFITPPFAATLVSLFIVFTGISKFIPQTVMAPVDLLGQATVPLAIFILGATLSSIRFSDMPEIKDVLIVGTVKFILLPGITFILLHLSGISASMPLFCSLVIIQAAAPPATNLILIVKRYGGDVQALSSMMFIQYMIAIIAMPFWLALWEATAA